jgi:hypothetical protein
MALDVVRADGLPMTSLNAVIDYLRVRLGAPSRAWWFMPANTVYLQHLRAVLSDAVLKAGNQFTDSRELPL